MIKPEFLILKGLIQKKEDKNLYKFLSSANKSRLESIEINDDPNLEIDYFENNSLINTIHYSWFCSIIENFSQKDRSLFIHSFDDDDVTSNILKKQNISNDKKIELSSVAKRFFQKKLIKLLIEEQKILPIDFLPKSDLNVLLKLTKEDYVKLIDYLAMYDLSNELKHILDTRLLKKIVGSLSNEKQIFLKKIKNYNEPFVFARMGLDKWNGNEEILQKLLHKKGLTRLAKAISDVSNSLLFYIIHKVDIGRGTYIQNIAKNKSEPYVSKKIIQNVNDVIDHLKLFSKNPNLNITP